MNVKVAAAESGAAWVSEQVALLLLVSGSQLGLESELLVLA